METAFQFVEPDGATVDGLSMAGMSIRAAGRSLGRLSGFIVDSASERIRYVVVCASGLFSKQRLVPFAEARIDFDSRVIDVDIAERELWLVRNLTPRHLLAA